MVMPLKRYKFSQIDKKGETVQWGVLNELKR